MKRRLALFFDGTWNKQASDTNVCRLYELTEAQRRFRGAIGKQAKEEEGETTHDPVKQLKFYHIGVGVRFGERLRGGMLGYGIDRSIKDGHLWLAQHYQPGDDLYIFGFSRGAYTARSLVGLIRKCGIPQIASEALVKEAYHIYREKQWEPDGMEATAYKKTFSWPDVKVKFIGVWDTVGALGIPLHKIWFGEDYYRWHDTELSRIVENAFHALAFDEHRPDFAATMWSNTKQPAPDQTVEQRWFPGAHADVGGGYNDSKLYQNPLRWMQQKAQECGLRFTKDVVVERNAHLAPMHDSLRGFASGIYAKLPWIYPYYRPLQLGVNERFDPSVQERIASPEGKDELRQKYRPPALKARQYKTP
jgi:uncharacterized protein (DUF2235 family)